MKAKRIFDLVFVIPGLLVLLPIFIVVSIAIKLDSSGPIFFRQSRVGRNGILFSILKFRTMVVNADKIGGRITIGYDTRVTRVGGFLRRYKLDELPQLINVIKGEMSLVGPRPEVPEYVSYYPEDVKETVLSVPPGITDQASIEFSNESEILGQSEDPTFTYVNDIIPVKLNYYIWYVENRSLLLDIKLIIRTIFKIIS